MAVGAAQTTRRRGNPALVLAAEHRARTSRNVVSNLIPTAVPCTIDAAISILVPPWSANPASDRPYPGRETLILGLVQHRVAIEAVKHWRAGRRRAPRWFVRLLDDELAAKAERIAQVREQLATYQCGSNLVGLEHAWKANKKRAAEKAAQGEKEEGV